MNWRDYCEGFLIQKQCNDWEGKSLTIVGALNNIPVRFVNKITTDETDKLKNGWVPSGTVPWISSIIGEEIKPNYFPKFLSKWVTRKIWNEEKWPLRKVFIKPSDRHKRFNGFVTSGNYCGKKKGPFICSEIVNFTNEWRYYVAYGKLIGAYWYWGNNDEEIEAPKLNIEWPEDWCGTADFGELDGGRIELIESHPPFACGWYGKRHDDYACWLSLGWHWLFKERGYNREY